MKRKTYSCIGTLLILLLMASCVYEDPKMTADGELGVDPTEVIVTADITLSLQIPTMERNRVLTRVDDTYRHRFIIDVYLNRTLSHRKVVYAALTDKDYMDLPVTLKLHARDYQLVVWSDYVLSDSEDDLYYDTSDLLSVISTKPYTGNTEYKDVQIASAPLELSNYRYEWGAKVPVRVELERPVTRYELVATDVERYLKNRPEAAGKKHTVTVKYEKYLPVGYNAYDGVPKHSYMYMQYSNSIVIPNNNTMQIPISFDYLFALDNEPSQQVTIEIKNEKGEEVARTYNMTVNYEKGKSVMVRGAFLTANDEPGVGVDPGFDGEKEIDTEITFL